MPKRPLDPPPKVPERSWEAYALYVTAEVLREAREFVSALQAAKERRKIVQDLGFRKEEPGMPRVATSARSPRPWGEGPPAQA